MITYEKILKYIDSEKYDIAIKYLEILISSSKKAEEKNIYIYALGVCYYKKQDFEKAIEVLDRIDMPRADLLKAFAYKELKDFKNVYENLEIYINRYEKKPEILLLMGIALEELKNYKKALEIYNEINNMESTYKYLDEVLYRIGVCNENMNKIKEAQENFNKVSEMFSDSIFASESNLRIGYLLKNQKKYKQAIFFLEKVIKKNNIDIEKIKMAVMLKKICQNNIKTGLAKVLTYENFS